ncbi:MAG: ABC transporter permease [Gammaproteobacteria bacterium]|nr:MAG: ABC transporter permease [Gammaproteobacteria bacterium]
MWQVFRANLKGIFRDRVFLGILVAATIFPLIPSVSSLSMRQVTELSITLSFSLLTFILLLLAIFLGGTSLWKDIERRYTFSIAGLPLTRGQYLLGKFAAIAVFLLLVSLVLGLLLLMTVYVTSILHPPIRPVVWGNLVLAVLFHCLKYILLVSFTFLFSTVSTSFFLPIFGTIAVFFVGTASQQVFDFLQSPSGQKLPVLLQQIATGLYYIVPNFTAFDLNVNAIYALDVPLNGIGLTLLYFIVYLVIILSCASFLFARRELN